MAPRTQNKSNYHYAVIWRDDKSLRETSREYFLTAYDVSDYFSVSRKTIMDKVKDPTRNGRRGQFKNIIIKRVNEPVYVRIENPIIFG